MIILSQAQDRITNFEQIKFIERDETAIFANVGAEAKNAFICLGNYSTLERAEQVLKEIIDWIENKCDFSMNNDGINITRKGDVFYMPKK